MNPLPAIPPEAATTAATALLLDRVGGRELVLKLLGPTFDYFGQLTRDAAKKATENVGRVLLIAVQKLGDRINENATIPPRVLREVVAESMFNEDELVAEYFGGVLAASRTTDRREDMGVYFAKLVSSMSALHLRAHYVIYYCIRECYKGNNQINIGDEKERRSTMVYIPASVFDAGMGNHELNISEVHHALLGLARLELFGTTPWAVGSAEHLREYYPGAEEPGIVVAPSLQGVELYYWAHGYSDKRVNDFFIADIRSTPVEGIVIPSGAKATRN